MSGVYGELCHFTKKKGFWFINFSSLDAKMWGVLSTTLLGACWLAGPNELVSKARRSGEK